MAGGYSPTPLWRKLGVHLEDRLLLVGPPPGWSIPDLPDGVMSTTVEASELGREAPADLIVAFFGSLADLSDALARLAALIFPAGAIWTAWPRRAGGHESDIRERDIRSLALALGLVDVKVAALDEDWSGLRLVWRRERRAASETGRG